MHRKAWIIGLAVMCLLPMLPGLADAHYIIISGQLRFHSLDCEVVMKNVQNLVNNPAAGECMVVGTVVEVECANPQGKIVRGTASHPVNIGTAGAPVAQDAAEKKKGRGHVTAEVLDDATSPTLGLTNEEAGCNNNWSVSRALLRQADLTVQVSPCTFQGNVCVVSGPPASQALFSCVLPAEFTLDDVPLPDNTAMSCTMEFFQHLN
jgi:hypothetical protein